MTAVAELEGRARVLVVDDDESVCVSAVEALSIEGYVALEAHDGAAALRMIRERLADAVVLDLGLPDIDGLDVLTSVRQFSDLPILLLGERNDEVYRIQGLGLGADDYVLKPCSARELAVRVGAVLRRARPECRKTSMDFDGIHIDLAAHEIAVAGHEVDLTPLEFKLLVSLAQSPRIAMTRSQLLQEVWGSSGEWQPTATVTEHVRRLRAKIEIDPQDPRWVITVRGIGYRFEPYYVDSTAGSAAS